MKKRRMRGSRRRGRRGKRGREKEREIASFFFWTSPFSYRFFSLPTPTFFTILAQHYFFLTSAFSISSPGFSRFSFFFFCRRSREERENERGRRVFEFFIFFASLLLHLLHNTLLLFLLAFFVFFSTLKKKTMQASLAARPAALRPARSVAPRRAASVVVRAAPVRGCREQSGLVPRPRGRKVFFFFFSREIERKKKKRRKPSEIGKRRRGGSDQLGRAVSLSLLKPSPSVRA